MTASPYKSARARAWRNMMVAAINAGLEQGHFGLKPDDNRWPGVIADNRPGRDGQSYVFHFTFPGEVPAVAYVGDIGHGELSIHVALWLLPEGAETVVAWNGGLHAGEAFAAGWLERQHGRWLQTAPKPEIGCRRHRLGQVAAAQIDPAGYADFGTFMM